MQVETIVLGVVFFTLIVLALVLLILFAKSKLVSSGDITISINGDPEKSITTAAGGKLLGALSGSGIFVSSACGGGGRSRGASSRRWWAGSRAWSSTWTTASSPRPASRWSTARSSGSTA